MNLLKITPWTIECTDNCEVNRDYMESIFSQGNGYMGVRGYAPEGIKRNSFERSTFLSGFFEYIKPGTTDMVNMPDFSAMSIKINAEELNGCKATAYLQRLNMQEGTLTRVCEYSTSNGDCVRLEVTRLLSIANEHCAAIRVKLTPLSEEISVELETGIDADVVNLPISDDQLAKNQEVARLWGGVKTNNGISSGGVLCTTEYSGRSVAMEYRLSLHGHAYKAGPCGKKDYAGESISATIPKGTTLTLDKLISVYSYRDCESPEKEAYILAEQMSADGFDAVQQANKAAWAQTWDNADIELEADDELQGAVRYNIFQLIQTDPQNDSFASIGARGLMHGRYKGCYFWDTEIFMLPMLLHVNPSAAKNLLLYRYNTLNDALESAKSFSLKGARYSWMASDTGYEQCGTWDTGCCEIHITADIAYAAKRYLELTADEEFFTDNAAELYIQTARYWASRFTYDKAADVYNLLFVKGPDEYCGVTTNNYYTVELAALNLQLAADSVRRMKKDYPNKWQKLSEKLCVYEAEAMHWEEISAKVVKYCDENTKLWRQDDTFSMLEPLDIESLKQNNIPLYHKISFDRLQRYQVLKQPDVIMLMSLLPQSYSMEEKKAAWSYYEPKTLHDSTLSFGIHALFGAVIGQKEKAWDYFCKSLYLDLHNVMKNTAKEGIHTAALGATWQALVFGFAGLWINEEKISCSPNLPLRIKAMKFKVWHKGKQHRVTIKDNKAHLQVIT